MFWRIINILSTTSWQDRGAAAVRGSGLKGSGGSLSPQPLGFLTVTADMFLFLFIIINIRARAVNCEGPIVIIIVCETCAKPHQFRQWGETAQFGVREHWRRKMAL